MPNEPMNRTGTRWRIAGVVLGIAGLVAALVWALQPEDRSQEIQAAADSPALGDDGALPSTGPTPTPPLPGAGMQDAQDLQAPVKMPRAAATATREEGCTFATGDTLSYRVSISTRAKISPERLGMPANTELSEVTRSTAFTMHLRALSASEGDPSTGRNATGRSKGAVLLAQLSGLLSDDLRARNVDQPFLLRVSPRCDLTGFARLDAADPADARTQQSIAYALDWHWPQGGAEAAVERHAKNGVGPYKARHSLTDAQEGLLAQRILLRYERFWDQGGGQQGQAPDRGLDLVPEDSLLSVRVGAGPWFDAMEGRERLAGEGGFTHTEVSAERVAHEGDALANAPRDLRRYIWEDLLARPLEMRAEETSTRKERDALAAARLLTTEQSLGSYVAHTVAGTPFAETWPPLAVYLEARPEAVHEVVLQLKKATIPPEATAGVYAAMGRARTPEAKRALLGIFRDTRAPAFERARAVMALVDRADVGMDLARELSAFAPEVHAGRDRGERVVARHAVLALGAMAGLKSNEQGIRDLAASTARDVMYGPGGAVTRRPGFSALANIGDPSLLRHAEAATRERDPRVREVAAIVIRRMDPADTEAFVSEWLAREDNWDVKRALYTVMHRQVHDAHTTLPASLVPFALRDLRTRAPAGQNLTGQAGLITRKALIRLLGGVAPDTPEATQALVEQIPFELEERSGLYDIIVKHLRPEDVRRAVQL